MRMICLLLNFNTTFVHVEHSCSSDRRILRWISIQHLYMWSKMMRDTEITELLISIQHLYMWSDISYDEAYAAHRFQYNICTCGASLKMKYIATLSGFQYNICTCGALFLLVLFLILLHFNTTFVHVEPVPTPDYTNFYAFQYNICTCGATLKICFALLSSNFNTTFVHVEHIKP